MVPVTSVSTGQSTSSVTIVAVPIARRREMCIPSLIHTPLEAGKKGVAKVLETDR